MAPAKKQGKRQPCDRELTVAHIREEKGADHAEVLFLESTRFYRLLRTNPGYRRMLSLLRHAMAEHRVLTIRFPSLESDVIDEVHRE